MQPRIQYAKTSDGVNIAYAVFGTEPAIVFSSLLFGSLHMYKNDPGPRSQVYDALVSLGWSVITYDGRGTGSSDRDTDDWTFEGRVRDLEAVVNRVAPDRFVLCGNYIAGPTSICYAVQQPDRVSHLVLSNTFAKGSEWHELVPAQRIAQQTFHDAEDDWEFVTLTFANAYTGYRDSERARRMAEAFRTGITAKTYMAFRDAIETIDVRHLLPQVSVPTIVIHDRTSGPDKVDILTRRLAPHIPNARLVETDDFAGVVDEFGREGEGRPRDSALPSGTAIIFFADIVDSTALTERLGDAAFRAKARELDGALRSIIRDNGGTPIEGKLLGDGVLAVFTSAHQAIEAALACGRAGEQGLPLHLGLHAGDVIREEGNVYGGAVNIAARISALSAPGEVLVSETVRGLARTSAGVTFADHGEQALKGVGESVRVWAVRRDA
jgi:class 3 adenylate cyclase